MDFADLNLSEKAERGIAVTLRHPITDEETDVVVTVKGKDSPTYRNKLADIIRAGDFSGDKAGSELLAAVTISVDGATEGDKPVTDYVDFYMKYNWAADQVNAAMNDREAFFKLPAKS